MICLVCHFLPFYAHVHTCNFSYSDEKQKTKVDSETVCFRLLLKGLIVVLRLWILSLGGQLLFYHLAGYFDVTMTIIFYAETSD